VPLVDMKDMLDHAYRNGYAVGAFDLVGLEFIEAILAAAERCRAPVILRLTESQREHDDFDLAMAAAEAAARRARVPVAIHLDHGASLEAAVRAINLGCNGVKVDASHAGLLEDIARTRAVVDMAHSCGVPVEGELGRVAGGDRGGAGRHADEIAYASAEEAKAYVERAAVDFLAVPIGTVRGRLPGEPGFDFDRLKRLREVVDIPFVIQGGTGLADEEYRRLIGHGVAKIDSDTALAGAAAKRMHGGYTALRQGMREAIAAEVERMSRLSGAAGRADEALARCRRWRPIAHVILYNVAGVSDAEVESVMARGREVLARIPGVRRVVTGWALTEKARYRYCWLIEFVHESVIASYRDHPEHIAFANGLFRPIAADRVSIDFAEIADAESLPAPP
jgi:fructose-bisphosphate aldolase class II